MINLHGARETMASEVLELDARGHRCPVPTLRLRRALAGASAGALVAVLVDDPMARVDIPHFANGAGYELVAVEDAAEGVRFLIRKPGETA